jgi:hypothetical protein
MVYWPKGPDIVTGKIKAAMPSIIDVVRMTSAAAAMSGPEAALHHA